jgi:hypothetical protein
VARSHNSNNRAIYGAETAAQAQELCLGKAGKKTAVQC